MANVLLLPGDGIGPEVMDAAKIIIRAINKVANNFISIEEELVGGACIDTCSQSITDSTVRLAKEADAVLLGAVGGPKWSKVAYDIRPEAGLLRLRADLELFANLRPAKLLSAFTEVSSLKPVLVKGFDILIVRELTGGVYFGQPKELVTLENGYKRAIDTQVYCEHEISRISKVAFEAAKKRGNKVHSIEKHNVMKTGVLWRSVVSKIHEDFTDCKLEHMLADNCAMQLVQSPLQFDVILADNLFGDLISDLAAAITGSLGLLPSASIGANRSSIGTRGLYEPVHGSAPDIANKQIANPLAMLESLGLALDYSLGRSDLAGMLRESIDGVLARGFRTADVWSTGCIKTSTKQMAKEVANTLLKVADK